MKLIELQPGINLILKVNVQEKQIEFPSSVYLVEKETVLIEAVRIEGRIIGLSGEQVHVDLICVRQGQVPIIWKNVVLQTVEIKKRVYYRVAAFSEGLETNRREAFRIFVGINGVAQMGANRKAIDIIVKDISESGFSFVTSENVEPAINVPVRMVFIDFEKQYSIMGLVVRKVVIDETKILYGCSITVPNVEIPRYINAKQRQKLSMNKGNAAARTKEALEEAMQETYSVAEIFKEEEERANRIKQNKDGRRAINQVQDKKERRDVFKHKYMGKRV